MRCLLFMHISIMRRDGGGHWVLVVSPLLYSPPPDWDHAMQDPELLAIEYCRSSRPPTRMPPESHASPGWPELHAWHLPLTTRRTRREPEAAIPEGASFAFPPTWG